MLKSWLSAAALTAALLLLFGHTIGVAATGPRLVFATYMTCCPLGGNDQTTEEYSEEIRQARAVGIDGFALDISLWPPNPRSKTNVDRLFDAADKTNFKLFIMADQGNADGGLSPETVSRLLQRFGARPSYYRFEGKHFISTYLGTEDWIDQVRSIAGREGFKLYFVPFLAARSGSTLPAFARLPNLRQLVSDTATIDGYFSFRVVGHSALQTDVMTKLSPALKRSGKTYMAGVSPYYRRAVPRLTVDDGFGMSKMIAGLRTANMVDANWVQIVTWNDWEESTYVQPFGSAGVTSANGRWKGLLDHGPILQFIKPFIAAYKRDRPVSVANDQAIVLYRPSLKSSRCETDTGDVRLQGARDVKIEKLQDQVYAATLLASPAEVELQAGAVTKRFRVAAGFQQVSIPASLGAVSARIIRNGNPVLESRNTIPITAGVASTCFNLYSALLNPASVKKTAALTQ